MSLQRFWYVSLKDGREGVAVGSEPERAISTLLKYRYREKLKKRQNIISVTQSYRMTAAGFFESADERVFACHVDKAPFGCRPIDPLWWLLDQDFDELRILIKQLNDGQMGDNRKHMRGFYNRIQYVMSRPVKQIGAVAMTSYRYEIAMMLRVSMFVDVSRQAPWKTHSGERVLRKLSEMVASKDHERCEQFIGIHAPNIGKSFAEQLSRFPGYDWGRLRSDQTQEIKRLCAAYGYNADEMPFRDVMALYREGPVGLEKLHCRDQLGFKDTIVNYEMREWPKRAKFQKYLRTLKKGQRRRKLNL